MAFPVFWKYYRDKLNGKGTCNEPVLIGRYAPSLLIRLSICSKRELDSKPQETVLWIDARVSQDAITYAHDFAKQAIASNPSLVTFYFFTITGPLAVTVLEGWLYAAGGSHNGSALKCVERYDPIKNDWSQVACMRLPRSHFGLATLQGRLFAIGGHCGISEIELVECYDPMVNKWADVNSMNKARMDHAVVTYNDRIYVVGGSNSIGALDSIEKYNPDLNLWLIIRNTMDPRSGACTAAIFGGEKGTQELYIIGGHDNHNRDLNSVKKLNLKFADYSTLSAPSLNQARVFAGVASA